MGIGSVSCCGVQVFFFCGASSKDDALLGNYQRYLSTLAGAFPACVRDYDLLPCPSNVFPSP